MGETAVIRSSDRSSFKRCRRKWGFTSHLQHNRTFTESQEYFWIGTGGHFALEDYHGYNYYKNPITAFRAYCGAYKRWADKNPQHVVLPASYEEQVTLGEGLLEYYLIWLEGRDPLETYWVDGVPQVEVQCTAELPFTNSHYDKVIYQATFDRVVVIDDELWILDYKFYNRDWTPNLDFDSQMSAYIWLAQTLYDRPVKGAILQKHFKRLPKEPRVLGSGKISTDKAQDTTAKMYRDALVRLYGDYTRAPLGNKQCLEALEEQEGFDRDKFIQRAKTTRTQEQIGATGAQILMELEDMLNPELPMYKNDTKDCAWDCSFRDICLLMDMGLDWEASLEAETTQRADLDDGWRDYLPHLNPTEE